MSARSIALAAALAALVALGEAYGYVRAALGLALGAAIVYLGFSYFGSAGQSPPEPEPEDVSGRALRYVCSMCGLELKVEVATSDKPPTHCREPMVLVRGDEPPPLRPVP